MVRKIKGMGLYSGLTIETGLDPEKQPFLYDHRIAGTPVLPGVMGIEALAETAQSLFPDLHPVAISDIQFSAPFKFYRNEPRTVILYGNFMQAKGDVIAVCRLEGARKLHGQEKPQVTTHFTARVRLSAKTPAAKTMKTPVRGKKKDVKKEAIYKLYFHGPAYQVLASSWRSGKKVVGKFAKSLPANHLPETNSVLAMSRLIELCFQTAGIWEMGKSERLGLPYAIDEVQVLRQSDDSKGSFTAIVTPLADGSFDGSIVDSKGNVCIVLRGYRTMALPEAIDQKLLAPLREMLA
jgi:hypothetical protein